MKAIIRMNAIKNNPVTTEDVDIAKTIFGPDVATLKGKMTHYTPVHVIEDRIKIPRELIPAQYSVTLCLDGMKTASVCNKCSNYTLGGFALLRFIVTMNFAPLWTL
jgi:hypothetical protein